ncbi:MAG: YihY/virulence factor BrkB family protein [Butyribacter sp.]|nr:YihY/virulence factor BrkB family protein [bacterium]MDY3853345.1 YihY/virulence factor BrkB family protein [Butyribacter sp.]
MKQINKNSLIKLRQYSQKAGAFFRKRSISAYSGQTAFFLILSFFPFLLFLFSIVRLTPLTEEMLATLVLNLLPSSFRSFIGSTIHDIYQIGRGSALSITAVSSIWLGSKAFLCLIQGLNSMYARNESRNYIVLRIFAFLYSILFALLILVILTIFVFGNWIHNYICANVPVIKNFTAQIIDFRLLFGFLILFVVFLFLYCILPNCRWKIRYHVPGAFLATLGWLSFSYLYSYYIDHFSHYSSIYGTMTTIALLMIWLYACMYILFLGGVLNEFLKHRSRYISKMK